ncbi:hypothetical protein PUN28_008521 [Cardiocondyla obscurior]|uniref:Uncharacterized protein n=1 Tax=Cardiocondyla obscurior TaxID=286306 RepID=A0AAW2FY39_9HYME
MRNSQSRSEKTRYAGQSDARFDAPVAQQTFRIFFCIRFPRHDKTTSIIRSISLECEHIFRQIPKASRRSARFPTPRNERPRGHRRSTPRFFSVGLAGFLIKSDRAVFDRRTDARFAHRARRLFNIRSARGVNKITISHQGLCFPLYIRFVRNCDTLPVKFALNYRR